MILNELITKETAYGSNYKKVIDVNPTYAELDEIIGRMVCYDYHRREQNINNVIYFVNKVIRDRNNEIKRSVKVLNKDVAKKEYKKINRIFAEDFYAIKETLKTHGYNELDYVYHNNVKYRIGENLANKIKLQEIYDRTSHKLLYETTINPKGARKCSKAQIKKYRHFIENLHTNYFSFYGAVIEECCNFYSRLLNYHAKELMDEIVKYCNEFDEFNKNKTLCALIGFVYDNNIFYNINNTIKEIVPIYQLSTSTCFNNDILKDYNNTEMLSNLQDAINKKVKDTTVYINKDNIKLVFFNKSKASLINVCNKYIKRRQQYSEIFTISDLINVLQGCDNELTIYDYNTIYCLSKMFE